MIGFRTLACVFCLFPLLISPLSAADLTVTVKDIRSSSFTVVNGDQHGVR